MKSKKMLFVPAFLLTLFSCSPTGNGFRDQMGNKILAFKSPDIDSYVEIQTSEELDSIARFDDALVIVTGSACSACDHLYPILNELIKETHYLIYTVDFQTYMVNYRSQDNKVGTYAFLYPEIRYTPTFITFRDGKALDAKGGYSRDTIKDWILSCFLDLDLYCLNNVIPTTKGYYQWDKAEEIDSLGYGTKNLDSLLNDTDTKKINILYTWKRCKDCTEYKEKVLYPYLLENDHGPVYFYELDGYYLLKRSAEEELSKEGFLKFSSFSEKYFLSDYPVEDSLGNMAGVAPTLITYQGDSHTLSVFRNDLYPTIGEDSLLRYRQSFYPEVLLLRSDTKVDSPASDSFTKALEELQDKAGEYETKACLDYLKENL